MTFAQRFLIRFVTLAVIAVSGASCASIPPRTDAALTYPAGETTAVGTAREDAADDPAIWAAPAGSTVRLGGRDLDAFILGTDKKAGLYAYALDGSVLQFLPDGLLNNVDLREGFVASGRPQVLIGASDRGRMGVALYLFDPAAADAANAIRPWGVIPSDLGEPYGFCLARLGDETHAILVGKDGQVRQYRVADGGAQGRGEEVRRFALGSISEGCVADERTGRLYVNEEGKGVWSFGLDPASGDARVHIQAIDNQRLVADVEGATLLREGEATYLLVSSQGDSAFVVWRVDGAPAYVGRFRVGARDGVDAVTGTDGLDARGGPVGPYPEGLVVVQDDVNEGGSQNFKLIDWREIKRALGIG